MKKQTAVEWYIEERKKLEYDYDTLGIGILKFIERKKEIEKQAKQMEKEQISNAYMNSTAQFANDARIDYPKSANDYYNETFGGNNE